MKRSGIEEEESTVRQSDDDNSSHKKQKVTNDYNEKNEINDDDTATTTGIKPQIDLMPKIPAIPPEIPLTAEEEAEIKRKFKYSYQTKLADRVYRSQDYALWPQIAINVFRQQLNIQNKNHASNYIRFWFAEHAGLRAPPTKAPRSSYWVYYNKTKSNWTGKWSQAKDSKKVGNMWKALSEEEKKVWHDTYDKIVEQFNVNDDFWQTEAEEWGKGKIQKLKENGEEIDPEKRVNSKFGGLIEADNFYYYKWW